MDLWLSKIYARISAPLHARLRRTGQEETLPQVNIREVKAGMDRVRWKGERGEKRETVREPVTENRAVSDFRSFGR